jgi:hypothetical protein
MRLDSVGCVGMCTILYGVLWRFEHLCSLFEHSEQSLRIYTDLPIGLRRRQTT